MHEWVGERNACDWLLQCWFLKAECRIFCLVFVNLSESQSPPTPDLMPCFSHVSREDIVCYVWEATQCVYLCATGSMLMWFQAGSLENNPLANRPRPSPSLILVHLSLFGHSSSSAGDWSKTAWLRHTHLCRLAGMYTPSQHLLYAHTNTCILYTQVETWSRCFLHIYYVWLLWNYIFNI